MIGRGQILPNRPVKRWCEMSVDRQMAGKHAKLQIVSIYRFSGFLCGFRYCRVSYDDALYTVPFFTSVLHSRYLYMFCYSDNCWQSGSSVFAQSIFGMQYFVCVRNNKYTDFRIGVHILHICPFLTILYEKLLFLDSSSRNFGGYVVYLPYTMADYILYYFFAERQRIKG